MELLERLDKFRHKTEYYGLKSGKCEVDGKTYVIVDFGLKEEKKIQENYIELSYLSEIKDHIEAREVRKEYKGKRAEIILGEFKELFYLEGDEETKSNLLEYLALEKFSCKGEIQFARRDAGYFVEVLGNLYFLPQGESLTHFRPGIWKSGYLELLKKTGLYIENLILYCQEEKEIKVGELEKVILLGKILERSLLLQYNYLRMRGKGRTKKYRGDFYRGRVLFALGYYYQSIEPFLKRLEELRRRPGLSEEQLERVLALSLKRLGEERAGRVESLELLLENVLSFVNKCYTRRDLVVGLGLLDLVLYIIKEEHEQVDPVLFPFEISKEIDLEFSRLVDGLGDERRMTSLTRKDLCLRTV